MSCCMSFLFDSIVGLSPIYLTPEVPPKQIKQLIKPGEALEQLKTDTILVKNKQLFNTKEK